MKLIDVIETKKNICLSITNDKLSLNPMHSYFSQVQSATCMLYTEMKWCDYVVKTAIDIYTHQEDHILTKIPATSSFQKFNICIFTESFPN